MPDQRAGRPWQRLVEACKTTYPWTCHLCEQPIPHGLHRRHPLAYQADHVQPYETHPHLRMDITNLRPSHRQCNQYRGKRPITPALLAEIQLRFVDPPRPALDAIRAIINRA